MKMEFSNKRLQISKANASIVVIVVVAAFVTTFSFVASKALLDKRSFQGRVINEKEVAARQLKENIAAVDSLVASYREFVDRPINIIGGNPTGNGARDGDNAKLVLDALPSKYDFPGLTSSIEKVLESNRLAIGNIAGVDDEVAQQTAETRSKTPIEIPFQLSVVGNYGSIQNLIASLERSIRPIKLINVQLSGSDNEITLSASAVTYYLPEKTLDITTKEVR